MEEVRIQKYLSECGVVSRRSAEKAIENGEVTINGEKAEIGQKIRPGRDKIRYRRQSVSMTRKDSKRIYLLVNKPVGYVTTMKDEMGRKCVKELVSGLGKRVYPVGRLDKDSEGLLIMTNDGELTNKLTHPRHKIPKIYHVRVKTAISADELRKLSGPMIIDDYEIQPVQCSIVKRSNEHTVIRMTLYEGRNRQIRKMCEQVGLEIEKLKRVAIGEISLGDLRPGKFRHMTVSQIRYLKNL